MRESNLEASGDLAAAFRSADETPDPARCPPPERIFEAVQGKLAADALRDLVEHVAVCGGCAEEWRLARALGAGEPVGAAVGPASTSRDSPWRWAAAAMIVGLLGGGLWIVSQRPAPPPVLRGEGNAVTRLLSPERLPRQDFELRWQSVPGAVAYELELLHDLEEVLAPTRVEAARLRVPAERLGALPDGTALEVLLTPIFDAERRGEARAFTVVVVSLPPPP